MITVDRHALWRLVGESTAAAESRAPGLMTRFDPGSWMVVCDANTWSANWLACHQLTHGTMETLRDYLDHAVASGRPASLLVGEDVRDHVLPLFQGRPMRLGGRPPLMWRDARPVAPNPRPYDGMVREVDAGEDIRPAIDLISGSFAVDPAEAGKALAGVLDNPAMRMFVAEAGGLDSVCLTYSSGTVTYIFILATAADRQRRGAGREAMTQAMTTAARNGTGLLYLMASSAGQPLYRALGFETYELPEFWDINPPDHE